MRIRTIWLCTLHTGVAIALSFWAPVGTAAEEAKHAAARPPTAPTPAIEPVAQRLLQEMGKYLTSAKHFSFHAEIDFDDVLPTGQKLQFGASYDVAFERPDRLYSEYRGDLGVRRFSYDGKSMTLYDPLLNAYATEQAPSSVDGLLDELAKSYGFAPPLSDFLHSDPYQTLRDNVLFGFYVGSSNVDGVRCNHLAFVEKRIDWQIWIEDGPQWVPRKVVITYKTIPGSPQFTAVLSDWDLTTPLAEPLFETQLPPDAERIDFLKLTGSGNKD